MRLLVLLIVRQIFVIVLEKNLLSKRINQEKPERNFPPCSSSLLLEIQFLFVSPSQRITLIFVPRQPTITIIEKKYTCFVKNTSIEICQSMNELTFLACLMKLMIMMETFVQPSTGQIIHCLCPCLCICLCLCFCHCLCLCLCLCLCHDYYDHLRSMNNPPLSKFTRAEDCEEWITSTPTPPKSFVWFSPLYLDN